MAYLPPFFIGFFGIIYYFRRWFKVLKFQVLKLGLLLGTVLGLLILSYIFQKSMRFLPYYKIFSPIFVGILLILAWFAASFVLKRQYDDFDYLASIGLVMLVGLYFLVTQLKRLFGRARFYLVLKDQSLYTPWYLVQGMRYKRDYYSIPSGHTTYLTIALWFVVVAFTIPNFKKHRKWLIPVVMIWIAFQSYLRVLMAEHFITDVIVSILLSALMMHLLYYLSKGICFIVRRLFHVLFIKDYSLNSY